MSHQRTFGILAGMLVGTFVMQPAAAAPAERMVPVKVDVAAAKKLARADHCLRCHAVARKKEGPSFQAIAYKYKGQADAQEKLVLHITSGEDMVTLSDGHKELHKFDKSRDPDQISNLVAWILSQ